MGIMRVDQLSDQSNVALFQLLQGVDIPTFVKDAELDDMSSVRGLESSAFADKVGRSFPINTPARVFVSNAFFQSKKASLKKKYGSDYVVEVESALQKAAGAFDITAQIENYNLGVEKRASAGPEPRSVCVISDEALQTPVAFFEYRSSQELAKQAEVFATQMVKIPFNWRREIAQGFLKSAIDEGVEELPTIICKYAGLYLPAPASKIRQEVLRRKTKLKTAGSEVLEKAAACFEEEEEVPEAESVFKLAEMVYLIEEADGAYSRPKTAELLPDIVDVLFSCQPTEKLAADQDVLEAGGSTFSVSRLQAVPAVKYKEAFGLDIDPTDASILRDVMPTMPRSDVALFRELIGD